VDLVGADLTALTLNGDATLDSIGSAAVTKLAVREAAGSGRELTIEFPPTYNVGEADQDGFMNPSSTKTAQVKVSQVQGEAQSLYVDYVFEMPSVSGKYLVYNPKVFESTDNSILPSASYVAFDPVRVSFALCMIIYFIGCNFFLCTSSSTQDAFFQRS
jgi:hypothetical protein